VEKSRRGCFYFRVIARSEVLIRPTRVLGDDLVMAVILAGG
jgi:hypothetical protein